MKLELLLIQCLDENNKRKNYQQNWIMNDIFYDLIDDNEDGRIRPYYSGPRLCSLPYKPENAKSSYLKFYRVRIDPVFSLARKDSTSICHSILFVYFPFSLFQFFTILKTCLLPINVCSVSHVCKAPELSLGFTVVECRCCY